MKRAKQARQNERARVATLRDVQDAELAQVIGGDVYLQYPRGSNNRLNEGG